MGSWALGPFPAVTEPKLQGGGQLYHWCLHTHPSPPWEQVSGGRLQRAWGTGPVGLGEGESGATTRSQVQL